MGGGGERGNAAGEDNVEHYGMLCNMLWGNTQLLVQSVRNRP